MTEIDHDESNLAQRLSKHYQQHYTPPPTVSAIWARVQPDLDRQGESASRLPQRAQWWSALAGFLVARRKDAFMQKQEEDTLMESTLDSTQMQPEHPRAMRSKQPFSRRLRYMFEVALAVFVVASLIFGWLAVTKWRSAQGTGPVLYTYASQLGEVVYDSQWTPDGKHLMFAIYTIATNHYRYLVWDAATGKARQTLTIDLPPALIGRVIVDSPDGRYALIRTNGASQQTWELKLANILTGQTKLIYQATYQGPDANNAPLAAFSEDSKYVAFIGADEHITIWDIAAGQAIQLTDALTTSAPSGTQWLAWSLDGNHIMVKNATSLQVWSIQTGHKLLNIVEAPGMSLFPWSPEFGNLGGLSLDGTRILTYNKQTGVIAERESRTLKILYTFAVQTVVPGEDAGVVTPLWVANGTRFFIQTRQAVFIWDGSTGKLVASISLKDDSQPDLGILPSSAGGRFIALFKPGNLVEIWDIVTGTKVKTIAPTIYLQGGIGWSSDGKYLNLDDYNGYGQIYNISNGQLVTDYRGEAALLSPDAQHITTWTSLSGSQTDTNLLQVMVQVLQVS